MGRLKRMGVLLAVLGLATGSYTKKDEIWETVSGLSNPVVKPFVPELNASYESEIKELHYTQSPDFQSFLMRYESEREGEADIDEVIYASGEEAFRLEELRRRGKLRQGQKIYWTGYEKITSLDQIRLEGPSGPRLKNLARNFELDG